MEEPITIKSLSAELGVSEQAIRSWCKRNEIRKTTKGKITSYVISPEVAEQIKSHYSGQRKESESNPQRKHNESDTTKAYIDNLLQQIEDLKADKAQLNTQINSLTAERQTTLAKLFQTLDENRALQLELKEYKETENKETVVEVSEVQRTAPEHEAPAEIIPEPEPKRSLFSKLFRKRSE